MDMPAPQVQSRFPALFKFRAPAGLRDAIDVAARRECTTASAWARRALLDALRADGVRVGAGGRVRNRARRAASGRELTAAPADSTDEIACQRPGNRPPDTIGR
jgi:hypothetical protein